MRNRLTFAVVLMLTIAGLMAGCKKEEDDNSGFFPVITTTDVSNVTYNSLISGGAILSDGGYQVMERGVCWGYNPEPTINDSKTSDGAGPGEFSSLVMGLSEETNFYLRAYATNVMGTGYGAALTVKTKASPCGRNAVFVDQRDGNSYLIIPIGDQCWMVNNLRYLPQVSPSAQGSNEVGHYYVYAYQGTDVEKAKATSHYLNYGVLYNWPAAATACPPGWHLPEDAEWKTLTNFLGGESVAGSKLKSTRVMPDPHPRWSTPYIDATNETGFTANPGGYRSNTGSFYYLGFFANWWTSTDELESAAHNRYMLHYGKKVYPNFISKMHGFSVRCVKDEQGEGN